MRQRAKQSGSGGPSDCGWDLVFGKLLLIFQMPKTGSQTVEASLGNCLLPERILRCHFLSSSRIAELRRLALKSNSPAAWNQDLEGQVRLTAKISVALRIRKLLRLCRINIPKLQIITAVREPIELGLSSIFQNFLYFVQTPEELSLELCSEILQRPRMLTSLEDWFDLELKPLVGLDVYATRFPHDRGFAIYENCCARVLLYRFEALQHLDRMLCEFLGREIPQVVSRNLSQDKAYRQCYDHVKQHLRLPADFLMRHYRSKLASHFYSPRELAGFLRRWSETSKEAGASLHREPTKAP
jgi:putative capsular polysaccharide synthesis protein